MATIGRSTMKQPKDEIITIMRKKPLQLISWGFCIYFAASLIINPFIMIHWQIGFFDIYQNSSLGLLSHFLATMTLMGTTFLTTYFHVKQLEATIPKQKVVTQQKVKQYTPAPTVVKLPEPVVKSELRDITTNIEGTFLKQGTHGQNIKIGDEEGVIYRQKDIIFDFERLPHAGIYGSSGSGKSSGAKSIITQINKQFRFPPTIILDAGRRDWPQALATSNEMIRGAIDHIYYIAEGRSKQPIGTVFPKMVIVADEFEVFFNEVQLLPKKERDEFVQKFSRLILTCRKLNLIWVMIAQTGASGNSIPTSIKANIANNFYLRMSKNASTHVHKVGKDLRNLKSGIAFYDRIDNFVQFDNINEVHVNALSWQQLEQMSNNAKNKWKLGELYEPVEV